MKVKIKVMKGGRIPEFKHSDDACADCYARIGCGETIIPKGARMLIPLGFAIELEKGWEAIIRPRSGLSSNGIEVSLGTIDAGFRGEVKACLVNNSGAELTVLDGERICQLAVREAPEIEFEVSQELSDTERGENGFGSTGIK